MKFNKIPSLFLIVLAIGFLTFCEPKKINSNTKTNQFSPTETIRRKFKGLKTNLNKRSIDLDLILEGGPGKNGIPAINYPKFISIDKTKLKDEGLGVLVSIKGEQRYYPYNILVWHEIVNDSFGGMDLAITFCPLCGSAAAFDRQVKGKTLRFGVSGKLYESNLLMYDAKTESLWSQSRGEAVVGDYTGTKLELVKIQVIQFGELKSKYSQAKILSEKTGYIRDYSLYPYGDYESSEDLYFPVSVQDKRFPAKEMMYVFHVNDKYVAFPVKDLGSERIDKVIEGITCSVEKEGGEINVYVDGKIVPGYFEMWFSWATHHQKNGIVWKMKKH